MDKLLIKQAWAGQMHVDYPHKLKLMEEEVKENPDCLVSDFEFVSLYFPCWVEDGESARMWEPAYPQTWNEYLDRLKILDELGYPKEVLLQQGEPIDKKIIEKYVDLGIRRFTVRNDENARVIKEILGDEAHVMASVTKCLSPDEINNIESLKWYDEICLYFFYNRSIDSIKSLTDKYEYCIMPNIACSPHCKMALLHWFEPNIERQEMKCIRIRKANGLMEEQGNFSRKEYEAYFKPYIHSVKIIGRESYAENHLWQTRDFLVKEPIDDRERLMRPLEHFNSEKEFPQIAGKGFL